MFNFRKRTRLIRRGLASRKVRRRRPQSELVRHLEYAPYAKLLIFAAFVGGLAILVFSGQQPEPTKNFVIALLVLATAITHLWSYFGSTNGHQALAGDLQQRQLPIFETRNGRIDHALCVCAACTERFAGTPPRTLRCIFCQPLG